MVELFLFTAGVGLGYLARLVHTQKQRDEAVVFWAEKYQQLFYDYEVVLTAYEDLITQRERDDDR